MTLDEAIKRYFDNAEYERTHGNLQGCLEFKQLAKLLKELKAYRKICHKEHVDDCLRAESEMKEYGLEEKELGEFNAVINGVLIPELIRIADKYNYNRDSMIKFAADTLTAMSELSTFERYKAATRAGSEEA